MIKFIEEKVPLTQDDKMALYKFGEDLYNKVMSQGGFIKVFSQRELPQYLKENRWGEIYTSQIIVYEYQQNVDAQLLSKPYFFTNEDNCKLKQIILAEQNLVQTYMGLIKKFNIFLEIIRINSSFLKLILFKYIYFTLKQQQIDQNIQQKIKLSSQKKRSCIYSQLQQFVLTNELVNFLSLCYNIRPKQILKIRHFLSIHNSIETQNYKIIKNKQILGIQN